MILSLVSVALACPVCGAPGASNELHYLAMTGVMSLLPLAFMASVGWWVYRAATSSDVER